MHPEYVQHRFEQAVLNHESKYGQKPSLLKISRKDFDRLLPQTDAGARFGLRIKGVATIGLENLEQAAYQLIP